MEALEGSSPDREQQVRSQGKEEFLIFQDKLQ
jgi:hypothetical protein